MSHLPFFIVPLTHPTWEEAVECVRHLPEDALPEVRLDLFPDQEPEHLVQALGRRCLVTCRRTSEGGRWAGSEPERLTHLMRAVEARPTWLDLEWDLPIPPQVRNHQAHMRLLRSVHVDPGVFDLEQRLQSLPEGDAYKWVGHAATLSDNARMKAPLAWAADHGLLLSAFLMGPKGIPSRCLQAAWGGSFTYAAPNDGPPAAPGQLPLSAMLAWRCHKFHHGYGLCGVFGSPVLHSKGPAFHNPLFQRNMKDLIYLPLECGDAQEAKNALEDLPVLGASLTAPLKETLPPLLGLQGPLNTLWRRKPGDPWQSANTDMEAIAQALTGLPVGPVLLLGHGGVARTSLNVLQAQGRPCLQVSLEHPSDPETVARFAPAGIVQATSLGMKSEDPMPFPQLLAAAKPSLLWAVEWIYKEDTAFARWAREEGLALVEGSSLFDLQARAQSKAFIGGCGE